MARQITTKRDVCSDRFFEGITIKNEALKLRNNLIKVTRTVDFELPKWVLKYTDQTF